jgi:hypothetical protein
MFAGNIHIKFSVFSMPLTIAIPLRKYEPAENQMKTK